MSSLTDLVGEFQSELDASRASLEKAERYLFELQNPKLDRAMLATEFDKANMGWAKIEPTYGRQKAIDMLLDLRNVTAVMNDGAVFTAIIDHALRDVPGKHNVKTEWLENIFGNLLSDPDAEPELTEETEQKVELVA